MNLSDKTKSSNSTIKQGYRFIVTGILSTIVNYAVNQVLISLGLAPEFTSAAGYASGIVVGYPLNKYWSFEVKKGTGSPGQSLKYFTVYAVTFGVNSVLAGLSYNVFDSLFPIHNYPFIEYFYYLPVIFITTVLNFAGCKFWVFKE